MGDSLPGVVLFIVIRLCILVPFYLAYLNNVKKLLRMFLLLRTNDWGNTTAVAASEAGCVKYCLSLLSATYTRSEKPAADVSRVATLQREN